MSRTGAVAEDSAQLAEAVSAALSRLAAAEAELAELCLRYADARTSDDRAQRDEPRSASAPKPGAFVSDELSVLLKQSPWETSRLLAQTRRISAGLPCVAAAAQRGELRSEAVRLIDQAARLAQDPRTLTVLEDEVVEVAASRTPQQLKTWLRRFLARLEPEAASHRRRVRLADRRVSVAQSVTGIGYVTGEVSAEDAAAIDSRLTGLAWALGTDDPRSEQQRRSDVFAGLLLGTTVVTPAAPFTPVAMPPLATATEPTEPAEPTAILEPAETLEVESIDPDTGEYLGTARMILDPAGEPLDAAAHARFALPAVRITETRRGPTRIGVIVPLSSLVGADHTPADLTDRSATLPAEVIRELAGRDGVLFTRLLTDDGGRLLDTTELGRHASARLSEAIRIRSGSCVYPTCQVSGGRCDLDHHEPVPRGPTAGANLDPLCRRHHRGKTFAGLAAHRDQHTVTWTLPTAHTYRCIDEPLPLPPPDDR